MPPTAGPSLREWVLAALGRYWSRSAEPIRRLPIPEVSPPAVVRLPPLLRTVRLPPWAMDAAVDGGLLIPAECIGPAGPAGPAGAEDWRHTDWLAAAAWYLDGTAERAHERTHGPIHSYAVRLRGWDPRLWDRAWVNRIALFLRRWAARELGGDEPDRLGPLPEPRILITHDVDAVHKTLALRAKHAAFGGYRTVRALRRGGVRAAGAEVARSVRFVSSGGDYRQFERIVRLESEAGVRSTFFVYAGPPGPWRLPRQALLDPSYAPDANGLSAQWRHLLERGWSIGLHASFDSWADPRQLRRQRERLETVLGSPATSCRQHWLRFSWSDTWAAQAAAGLSEDMTLGFNDRPGFRNGAALRMRPHASGTGTVEVVPMVLMDSHLYDYRDFDEADRAAQIARWIAEVRAVGGEASVLWHQRVLSDDYGWSEGFRRLLEA